MSRTVRHGVSALARISHLISVGVLGRCLRPLLSAALLAGLFLTGCAVPLGPGFRLRTRQMVLGEAPAPSAPVRVRVADRMENTGNRPLAYLDLTLPVAIEAGRSNLTIRVDGRTVPAVAVSEAPGAPLRVRFDPPWPPRQAREVVLEYDLTTDPVRGGVAAATPDGFYLADPLALPFWLTPVGVFASGEVLSRDERFELSLPADFRVAASGRQQRRRSPDGSFLYRFRTSDREFPSFVIAGRYQQQIVITPRRDVVFWTFQPLDPDTARMAAARLAASAATFERLFGPLPGSAPLRVVETVASVVLPASAEPDVSAAAFPHGLLLGPRAFAQGIASEPVLRSAETGLVRIWFGWRVSLRPEMETLLGPGLGLFGVALAAEARGGQQARHLEIVRLLADYDRARVPGDEGSLLRSPAESTPQQRAADALKAALFLAALDDLAGQDNFERAVRRLQDAMAGRGLSLSLDDLRSSLESTAGTAMASVFRLWLNRPGVPDDFRARYSPATPPAPAANAPSRAGPAASATR
ncbi:MAG TPA: hypothetical protein VIG89_09395 [Candidatus Acidoferrales bacterium]